MHVGRQTRRHIGAWTHGQIKTQTHGQINRQINIQIDTCTWTIGQTHRSMDRETHGLTDRQTHRQTVLQSNLKVVHAFPSFWFQLKNTFISEPRPGNIRSFKTAFISNTNHLINKSRANGYLLLFSIQMFSTSLCSDQINLMFLKARNTKKVILRVVITFMPLTGKMLQHFSFTVVKIRT